MRHGRKLVQELDSRAFIGILPMFDPDSLAPEIEATN